MNDNDKRNLCTGCGLMPQKPVRPKPPVCGCKKKKCCKKDCCKNDFVFRKVVIPVALGDDETGKAKPENGAYTNSYVEYEANGAQYMYDSYGVYTKIEGGGSGEGTLDFNELENRPKYAGEEMTGATSIPDVAAAVAGEATLRENADTTLQGNINALAGRVTTAEGEITTIEGKIPEQASATNQLADKNFVNSSIATNTANFIGTFNSVAELEAYSGTVTNNDYAFVIVTDTAGNTAYDRYKYNGDTEQWLFEYELNNSSFTANQWAAINSGITSGDVSKLSGLANIKTIGNNLTLDADGELSATDTVYNDFTGTDGVNAGTAGLVPAPATTDAGKYLKADGTWDSVSGGIPTTATFWGQSYDSVNNSVDGTFKLKDPNAALPSYIEMASASNTAMQLRYASNDTRTQSLVELSIYNQDPILRLNSKKNNTWQNSMRITQVADPTNAQDAATKNYTDNLVVSYASLNGSTAPTTATEGKYVGQLYYDTTNEQLYFLKAIDDTTTPATYTWETVGGGSSVNVVQTTGTSTTDVMSQAAVTDCLYGKNNQGNPTKSSIVIGPDTYQGNYGVGTHLGKINTSYMGAYSIAIGDGSSNEPPKLSNAKYRQIAIGGGTNVSHDRSIALGYQATTGRDSELSIGKSNSTRYIANVTDPALPQDAATKNYTDNLVISYASLNGAGAPTTSTAAQYVGQLYYDTTNDDMYYCSAITAQGTTPETYEYTWNTVGGGGGLDPATTFWGQTASGGAVNGDIALTPNATGTYSIYHHGSISTSPSIRFTQNSILIANFHGSGYNQSSITCSDSGIKLTGKTGLGAKTAIDIDSCKIINVADPTAAQDAVTKNYCDSFYPVGAVFTSTSATAPTIAGGTWTEIGTQTIGSSTIHYYERTA